MKRTTSPMTRN
jgi:hypothetical protein